MEEIADNYSIDLDFVDEPSDDQHDQDVDRVLAGVIYQKDVLSLPVDVLSKIANYVDQISDLELWEDGIARGLERKTTFIARMKKQLPTFLVELALKGKFIPQDVLNSEE